MTGPFLCLNLVFCFLYNSLSIQFNYGIQGLSHQSSRMGWRELN